LDFIGIKEKLEKKKKNWGTNFSTTEVSQKWVHYIINCTLIYKGHYQHKRQTNQLSLYFHIFQHLKGTNTLKTPQSSPSAAFIKRIQICFVEVATVP
jgi:hypothetical protein